MLSQQSTSRSRLVADRRNRGHDRLSPQDGHASGAAAISPTQSGDRVLSRLDQKQTGIASVPAARPGQSANRNALGLSDLQPATVDATTQTASLTCNLDFSCQMQFKPTSTPLQTAFAAAAKSIFASPLRSWNWFFHSFKPSEKWGTRQGWEASDLVGQPPTRYSSYIFACSTIAPAELNLRRLAGVNESPQETSGSLLAKLRHLRGF